MIQTPFGNIVVSDQVPKDEVHLVTPGEYIHYLKPGESPYAVSIGEISHNEDGTMSFNVTVRRNGTLVEEKPPQVHKIVNIGKSE